MKCEIERMEIIDTFYFFAFLKKVIKSKRCIIARFVATNFS